MTERFVQWAKSWRQTWAERPRQWWAIFIAPTFVLVAIVVIAALT